MSNDATGLQATCSYDYKINMSIQGVLLLLIPDCLTFRVCKIGIFFNNQQIMQLPKAQIAALGVWHHALPKKIVKSLCSEKPFLECSERTFCLKCFLIQLSFLTSIYMYVHMVLHTMTRSYFTFLVGFKVF